MHVLSIHILTSEAGHDGLDRAAHHRAHLPPLPLPQNMPQHRRARHQLPGRARNEHSRRFYNEVSGSRNFQPGECPSRSHLVIVKFLRRRRFIDSSNSRARTSRPSWRLASRWTCSLSSPTSSSSWAAHPTSSSTCARITSSWSFWTDAWARAWSPASETPPAPWWGRTQSSASV